MLTLVLNDSIKTVDDFNAINIDGWKDDIQWFSDIIYDYQNYTIFINFLPDANGNWYAWGQNPFRFIKAYQTFAIAIKEQYPNVELVWTMGQNDGYPLFGSAIRSTLNDSEIGQYLDSNFDGVIDEKDDPFNPYYPGGNDDSLVDWIGLNFEFSGVNNVTGISNENIIPRDGAFYDGFNRFYQLACKRRRKPVMLTTSSYYSPTQSKGGNDTDLAIKNTWINTVYSKNTTNAFPFLKAILWYEYYDQPTDTWYNITSDPQIVATYKQVLSDPFWSKNQTFGLTPLIQRYAEFDQAGYQMVNAANSLIQSRLLLMVISVTSFALFCAVFT